MPHEAAVLTSLHSPFVPKAVRADRGGRLMRISRALPWVVALLLACASAEAVPRWSMLANDRVIALDVTRTGRNYHAATHDALDLWSLPWEALPCPGTGVLPPGSPLIDLARRADGKFDVTLQRVLLIPVGEEGPGTDPVNGCVFQEAHYVGEFTDREGALAFDATQLGKFPVDDDSFLVLTKLFDSCPIPVANRHTCLGGRFPWNPVIDAPLVDTDGDGLPDEWELNGVRLHGQFLDLHAMGANPEHKDLFVQLDATPWTRLESDVLEAIAQDFAREPIPNPDVQPGINIHIDAGPDSVMDWSSRRTWQARSRASETLSLPDHFGRFVGGCDGEFDSGSFHDLMQRRLEPVRARVFRYAVVVKHLGQSCALGVTPAIPGRGFVMANYLSNETPITRYQERGVFMHELGHALGLRHGGGSDLNFKPNYQSVMNYLYTDWGIPRFGEPGPGDYHYSSALPSPLNTIDETHLDESLGFKPVVPDGTVLKFRCRDETHIHRIQPLVRVDMNCDGAITEGQREIDMTPERPNEPPTRLRTFDDLNHLHMAVPRRDGEGGSGGRVIESMTPDELARAEATAFNDRESPTVHVTLRRESGHRVAIVVAHDDVSLASATVTVGTFLDVQRLSAADHFVRDATRNIVVPADGVVTVVVGDAFGKSATAVVH
jgi:hypothetical protein